MPKKNQPGNPGEAPWPTIPPEEDPDDTPVNPLPPPGDPDIIPGDEPFETPPGEITTPGERP